MAEVSFPAVIKDSDKRDVRVNFQFTFQSFSPPALSVSLFLCSQVSPCPCNSKTKRIRKPEFLGVFKAELPSKDEMQVESFILPQHI